MKQSAKKPRPAKKNGSTVRPRSKGRTVKKKRKKLDTRDRIRAALAAAALILAAAVSSLAVVYLNSAKAREYPPGPAAAGDTAEKTQGASAGPEPELPGTAVPEAGGADQPGTVSSTLASPPVVVTQAPIPAIPELKAPAAEKTRPPARLVPPAPRPEPALPAASVSATEKRPVENRLQPAAALPPGGINERPGPSRGSLGFVIDDAGYNLRDLDPFLKFPGPLTIAVLPGLPYSAEAARRIRAAGKEVFLHQPMEALGKQNPGPGAIRSGMDADEVRAVINRNLDELWPVAGINNHEGSRITMDEDIMGTVLALCRERGILFLDSRTTAETAAPRAARQLGMSIGERDVFVDNVQEKESMIGYINTGLNKAEQNGSAIMIGHVWSPALAPLLAELFPNLKDRGYSFSPVSKIIRGAAL